MKKKMSLKFAAALYIEARLNNVTNPEVTAATQRLALAMASRLRGLATTKSRAAIISRQRTLDTMAAKSSSDTPQEEYPYPVRSEQERLLRGAARRAMEIVNQQIQAEQGTER